MPFPRQRLILVVDDEDIIREVFESAFKGQTDVIIDTASTASMAIEKVRSIFWDLIFLDIKLGGDRYAGMKVLEELRKIEIEQQATGKPYIKTLTAIMSGSICFNDITKRAQELDCFLIVDKPTQFTEGFVRRVVNRLGIPLLPPIDK